MINHLSICEVSLLHQLSPSIKVFNGSRALFTVPQTAKVHPLPSVDVAVSSSYVTAKRESFTIWMKSLLMKGNGCTVFNENGEIVYRIDNYDNKGSNEVYLMDLWGQVPFTLQRRVWFNFGQWKGFKGQRLNLMNKEKPKFQVTKKGHVILRAENDRPGCYKIEASAGKSAFKLTDCRGRVVAEARRKQSSSGVLLGDDVLTLVVEPLVDHSFVMALATVYGLMHRRM